MTKESLINLVKEHNSIGLVDLALELFVTVSEAKIYIDEAIAEGLIEFDEQLNLYHYKFTTQTTL